MQQRRGTAQQWTDADPILAAGEIGFEVDTNQFKIGDGVNHWSDLSYFKNLEDLGGSLDDYILLTEKGLPGGVAVLDVNGLIPISQLPGGAALDAEVQTLVTNAIDTLSENVNSSLETTNSTLSDVQNSLSTHSNKTTDVHGIDDTALLVKTDDMNSAIESAITTEVSDRNSAISQAVTGINSTISSLETNLTETIDNHIDNTVSVHGIEDTSALATKSYADAAVSAEATLRGTAVTNAIQDANAYTDSAIEDEITARDAAIDAHVILTQNIHGIADTSALATKNYADNAVSTHNSDSTDVHGIADTSALATKTYADNAVSTHSSDTTNVHGIADTADLATKSYADSAANTAKSGAEATAASALSSHEADTTNIHGIADTSALATKTYADSAVSTHEADTTSVHGIADTSKLVTTDGTQTLTNKTITSPSGLVKADVGLGNVDNTSDANKPISNATQTALDLKAPKAAPTFTGTTTTADLTVTGNLTVNGTTTTVSSTNLEVTDPLIYIGTGNSANSKDLGVVGHFDNGTYQHTGIVRDATDGKWKLFSGVTTEPSDTIDFATYTKDALVMGALEATSATIGNVSNTELQYLDGVTSAIQTQLDAKAPLASPTFTGTVTLPSGTVTSAMILDGTIVDADINSSAAIAQSKISGLVSDLAAKAPLASPTFTGTVTVSASGVAFTDGTQTKEGVPSRTTILQKSAAYTLSALTERDNMIEVNSSSAVTISIPTDAAVNFPVGTSIDILQTGTGQVTIAAATPATTTVNATPGLKLRTQWSSATLFKRAANLWVVMGDLSA